jgi:hypothetical protein
MLMNLERLLEGNLIRIFRQPGMDFLPGVTLAPVPQKRLLGDIPQEK